jgi:hypothetical protein
VDPELIILRLFLLAATATAAATATPNLVVAKVCRKGRASGAPAPASTAPSSPAPDA